MPFQDSKMLRKQGKLNPPKYRPFTPQIAETESEGSFSVTVPWYTLVRVQSLLNYRYIEPEIAIPNFRDARLFSPPQRLTSPNRSGPEDAQSSFAKNNNR